MLLDALPFLRQFDAIVVPERTTTAIRHFLSQGTRLIFTPHGAGDRAITFDVRDRHFDFALVAGAKSEQRMLDAGTIRPGHYAVNRSEEHTSELQSLMRHSYAVFCLITQKSN